MASLTAEARGDLDALIRAMNEAMAAMEKLKGEKEASAAVMDAAKVRADAAEKRASIIKANALKLLTKLDTIRKRWDAMKAVQRPCDECGGTGKVDDAAQSGQQMKCDLCGGDGQVRHHLPVKGADAVDEPAAELEAELPDEELDADELEVAQETEAAAGQTAKMDVARKALRDSARADAVKRAAALQRRIDQGVCVRTALETTARRYGIDPIKLDDVAIRKAVVLRLSPKAKLDGIAPGALVAKFDALVEAAGEPQSGTPSDMARAAGSPFVVPVVQSTVEPREDGSHLSGYERMVWQQSHDADALLSKRA